ncbi:MAG: enoyl-CoA hydratase/isomerase family protein [Candidatus Brocadiaceae bacterium]|nr:enoyl-CoA hydratase/isomerase family protein [Candidatus Brocadiaceae bacterium]
MEKSGIIEFVQQSDIAYLTIDNPPKNRLRDPVIVEPDTLKGWLNIEGLKGVIIAGRGHNFSEGADLEAVNSMKSDPKAMSSRLNEGKKVLTLLKESPVPVVAAIRGACLGGGLEIALACHLRIAANTSLLGFPEAELGLLPGLGGTVSCVEEIGIHYALPFLLSSEMVTAERALELGLVHYVVPKKEVLNKAESLLTSIVCNKKPIVINKIMKAVIQGQRLDRETALREESLLFAELAAATTKGLGSV